MKALSYLDCGCAIMEDGSRSLCPSCAEPPEPKKPLVFTIGLVDRIASALGTEESGDALVEVARNAHTAELENARLAKECEEHKQAVIDAMSVSNDLCEQREGAIEELKNALRIASDQLISASDRIKALEAELAVRRHECAAQTKNAIAIRAKFTNYVGKWACEKDALRSVLKSVRYAIIEAGDEEAYAASLEKMNSVLSATCVDDSAELAILIRPSESERAAGVALKPSPAEEKYNDERSDRP